MRIERAATEQEVTRTLGQMGVAIPTSDGEALLELRDRYRAIVAALWSLASGLRLVPSDDGPGGTDGIYGRTWHQTGRPTGEAKPHVVMVMLAEWSDRLAKIDEACIKLGLRERMVAVAESQAREVWEAVDRGLRDGLAAQPGLYGPVREAIGRAVRHMMAELPAGEMSTTKETGCN